MALLLATACAVACAVGGVGQGFEVSRSCLLVQRYRGGFDFGGTLTDGTAETPDDEQRRRRLLRVLAQLR